MWVNEGEKRGKVFINGVYCGFAHPDTFIPGGRGGDYLPELEEMGIYEKEGTDDSGVEDETET